MATEREFAAVDTDFLLHLVATEGLKPPISAVIARLFEAMQVTPIMHELVHKHELHGRDGSPAAPNAARALELFDEKIIEIQLLRDIFADDPEAVRYYREIFPVLYYEVKRTAPPVQDVLTGWAYGASLGEVHSAVMCMFIGCGLFLSDDSDAQTLADTMKNKYIFDIIIYDRKEACHRAAELSAGALNHTTRTRLAHSAEHQKT